MKIKVYNEKGTVRITKIITSDNVERPVFLDVQDGEVAEINISLYTATEAKKYILVKKEE